MRRAFFGLMLVCGVAAAGEPPSADVVIQGWLAAGIKVENVREGPRDTSGKPPNSYKERKIFADGTLTTGKGGQVFTCTRPDYCDAIYDYFKMLASLAGPYLYKSPSGLVVAQINKGLAPDVAERYEAVLKGF